MLHRPNIDSTEDSVSSSSSANNGDAAADGWHGLQAAVAVAEATTATVTATATTTVSTKAAAVRRVGPSQPPQAQSQQRRLRRPMHRGRRRLLPPLRDLAPSDESAEDADDEADEADEAEAGRATAAVREADNAEDDEDADETATFNDDREVDEDEVDEDLRTSDEVALRPATNDDYVEFSIAVTSVAGVAASSALGRGVWLERLLQPPILCRQFSQRPLATVSSASVASSVQDQRRWPPAQHRRPSAPCLSPTSATTQGALASDSAAVVAPAAEAAALLASPEDIRLPPDVFERLLREVDVGRRVGGDVTGTGASGAAAGSKCGGGGGGSRSSAAR